MSERTSSSVFSLVYGSSANRFITHEDLESLVTKAQLKNERAGITGYLYHKKLHFFQYLEGERNAVLELMDAISADERHTVLRTIHLGHRDQRMFSNWSMRLAKENEVIGLDGVVDLIMCNKDNPYDDDSLRPLLIDIGERIAGYLKKAQQDESHSTPGASMIPEMEIPSQLVEFH